MVPTDSPVVFIGPLFVLGKTPTSPDEREKAHEKYPKKYSNCLPSNAKNLFAVYFVFGMNFFSREFFRVNRNKIFRARLDVIKLFRLFADPIRSESTA